MTCRSIILVLCCVLLGVSADGVAQQQPSKAKVRLEMASPHETVRTYFTALQPDNERIDVATKTIDFQDVPQVTKQRELARKLKAILDGRGLIVEMDHVTRDVDYIDSASGGSVFSLFPEKEPRVYLSKTGKVWMFSRITVSHIPDMYSELYPYGLDHVVDLLPRDGPIVLGLALWQIIGLVILLAGGTLIGWALGNIALWIVAWIFAYWGARGQTHAIVHTAVRPLAFLVGMSLTRALLPGLLLPVETSRMIIFALEGIVIVAGIVIAYRLSDLLWFRLRQRAEETESQLDDALIPLVERTAKVVVIFIGVIILLNSWEMNVTALLAGVSIGGIAFAFAAQSTIANLFGSAMIFLDRPFQIGDWIKSDGVDGTVEAIGFRSTRIRTFANSLMSVPNARMADMSIDNMGLRVFRRYSTTLGLQYDTPPESLEKFVSGVRTIILEHPKTVKDEDRVLVYFHTYDNSSLNVMVYLFFEVPNWREELTARHELNMSFLMLAKELGVSYAFPTQTVHIESMPGKPPANASA